MSAVDGVNRAKVVAGTRIEQGYGRSAVLSTSDSYVATALEDASTIEMGELLPEGAKVQLIVIKHPALATGRTVKVGNNYNDDEFLAATSVATAGTITIPCGNYVVGTSDLDNQLLITTAGIFNSATPIQLTCFFTL